MTELQTNYGLGRIPAEDPRDTQYLLAALPTPAVMPSYKYYTPGITLNQGQTPSCVGHAWMALRIGSPHRLPLHDPQ
jgi:hypothetical protein